MKFVISSCIFSLTIFFGVSTAWSIPNKELTHTWGRGSITISGPADSSNYSAFTMISGSATTNLSICNNSSLSYDLAKIEYTPFMDYVGEFPTGFSLFESGAKGLTIAPAITGAYSPGFGIGGSGSLNLPREAKVIWTGNVSNFYRTVYGFRYDSNITLYKGLDRLENGTIIPRQTLYRFTCYDTNNVAQETVTLTLNSFPINVNVTGCTPDSKATIVNMTGIPVANIENAASSTLLGTTQQTFSLKCDPDILLKYSVVDLNDPTNKTTTSTLTADSTAAGVGYAITSPDGTRLQFGPDGSAANIPGQTKYLLGTSGAAAANNPFSYQLGFSYVRKPEEAIKIGSAKSLVGITYSYQ